jgi:hypothetical protein
MAGEGRTTTAQNHLQNALLCRADRRETQAGTKCGCPGDALIG